MATLETLEWAGKILAVAGPVLTFGWWVFRTFHRYHRLQIEHADLKKTLTAERAATAKEVDALRRERDALREDVKQTAADNDRLQHELIELRARSGSSSGLSPELMDKMIRDYRHDLERLTGERHAAQVRAARVEDQLQAADQQRAALAAERDTLRAQLAEQRTISAQLSQEMERRVDELLKTADELRARLRRTDEGYQAAHGQIDQLTTELGEARRRLTETERRISDLDGRLWLRPNPSPPPFRPLADRRAVILSVLNLKGGVGKTTVTANLAATLGEQGRRVLLLDLDYQRSLSMLLFSEKDRQRLHGWKRCLQHFLVDPNPTLDGLLGCAESVGEEAPRCALITNSDAWGGADALEETENRLMAEWLVGPAGPDVRFHLRRALHDAHLRDRFDYVLLDCPPRLSTACVNAVAASDFVLIPVLPDAVSTRAVENLLRALARLRAVVCPDLAVLGIVPNMVRTHGGSLVQTHDAALVNLKELAAAQRHWPAPVPVLGSAIPDSSAFGKTAAMLDEAGALRLAVRDAKVADAFRDLAEELEQEIERHASGHPSTVPAKSGPRPEGRRRSGAYGP